MATVKRIQADFTEASFVRLAKLKESSNCATNTEVMQRSLRIYEYFNDAVNRGDTVKLIDKDGKETIVEFL